MRTRACPNAVLDPTGIVVNQRWRNDSDNPLWAGTWAVITEPDAHGMVRMARVARRPSERQVSVGTLLAYWTCLDVPS